LAKKRQAINHLRWIGRRDGEILGIPHRHAATIMLRRTREALPGPEASEALSALGGMPRSKRFCEDADFRPGEPAVNRIRRPHRDRTPKFCPFKSNEAGA
jgi:hypothetical protein